MPRTAAQFVRICWTQVKHATNTPQTAEILSVSASREAFVDLALFEKRSMTINIGMKVYFALLLYNRLSCQTRCLSACYCTNICSSDILRLWRGKYAFVPFPEECQNTICVLINVHWLSHFENIVWQTFSLIWKAICYFRYTDRRDGYREINRQTWLRGSVYHSCCLG